MIRLLTGWDVMRLLRLGLGLYFAFQAYTRMDALSGFLGAFLLLQAITNTGCCAYGSCAPASKMSQKQEESAEIIYETIKPK